MAVRNLLDPAALVAHDDDLDILDEIITQRCQLEGAMASRAAAVSTANSARPSPAS
jgi:hypothetical protein